MHYDPSEAKFMRPWVGYLGFTALFVLIILGGAYSLSVVSAWRQQLEQETLAADLAQAELGAAFLGDFQRSLLLRLQAIASRNQFRRAVAQRQIKELRDFLDPLVNSQDGVTHVFLADRTGKTYLSIPPFSQQPARHPGLPPQGAEPWASPAHPGLNAPHRPESTLSVPILAPDNQALGFLGICQRAELWDKAFSRLSTRPGRTFFLFDQQGGIIASGLDPDQKQYKALKALSLAARKEVLAKGFPVARLVQEPQEGPQAFITAAPVIGLSWVLTVAHDYPAAMAQTEAMGQNIFLFLALLFLCLLLLGFMLASRYRQQQRSIKRLGQEARHLGDVVVQREADLVQSTLRYQSLVQDLPDLVYEMDAQGRLSFVNQASLGILGFPPQEMIGRPRRDFVLPEDQDKYDQELARAQEGQTLSILALRHLTKDGQVRWLSIHSRGIFDAQGRFIGRRGVGRDVTKQVLAESRVRELSGKLIQAQEEERKRIALDLHDEMGQLLSALKIGLQAQARRADGSQPEMEKLIRLTQKVMDRARALAHRLRPSILDNFGLRAALEDLCETLAESHLLEVEHYLDSIDERRLAPEVAISLFRFVQEALTNVIRHSGSSKAEVRLSLSDLWLTLSVIDFGHGFDLEQAMRAGKNLGLVGMEERLGLIGGRLRIQATPQGTTLTAEAPLGGER